MFPKRDERFTPLFSATLSTALYALKILLFLIPALLVFSLLATEPVMLKKPPFLPKLVP